MLLRKKSGCYCLDRVCHLSTCGTFSANSYTRNAQSVPPAEKVGVPPGGEQNVVEITARKGGTVVLGVNIWVMRYSHRLGIAVVPQLRQLLHRLTDSVHAVDIFHLPHGEVQKR